MDLVEIHWTHYIFFLLVVLLDLARGSLSFDANFEPIFLIGSSAFNIISIIVLAFKMTSIYWIMLRAPAEYYQDEPNRNSNVEDEEENSQSDAEDDQNAEVNHSKTSMEIENSTVSLNNLLWRRRSVDRRGLLPLTIDRKEVRKVKDTVPTAEIEERNKLAHSMHSINQNIEKQYDSRPNPTIQGNAEDAETAKSKKSINFFPKWVVKILPRLGRVPSPGEKLFWFGSYKFYIWCVEWVLFFTTINVSATAAKLAFHLKKDRKQKGSDSVSLKNVFTAVHKTEEEFNEPQSENSTLLAIALIVSILSLLYVLLRIASIMKKYIFIMNNAQLLPMEEMETAIADVDRSNRSLSAISDNRDRKNDTAHTETETLDKNEESNDALRRKLTKYISTSGGGEFLSSPSSDSDSANGT